MKFTCSQGDLQKNLAMTLHAIASRPSHPVLGCVLISTDPKLNKVSLSGYDLSMSINAIFDAEVEEDGKVAVPAKFLDDIISRLPGGNVTLTLNKKAEENREEGIELIITTDFGDYNVRSMEVDAYPELPTVEGITLIMPAEGLLQGIKSTLFSTSSDETKQVLTGVHFLVSSNEIEYASTDGHRLTKVNYFNSFAKGSTTIKEEEKQHLTIPAKSLKELEKLLSQKKKNDTESNVTLCFNEGDFSCKTDNYFFTSRTLQGVYPPYNQLIPNEFKNTFVIERKLLIDALERIAVVAEQKNNVVRCCLNNKLEKLQVSAQSTDVGSGKELIPIKAESVNLDIGFNIKYLIEGLRNISTMTVKFHMNTPTTPIVITPIEGIFMQYLIMPVQIRND